MTLISIKKIVKQVLQEEPPLASVGWANVNNKPALFPPTAHGHAWNEISDKPVTFPATVHTHQWNAIENKPSTFPPTARAHDWSEVQNKPATFTPSAHTHDWNTVENKPVTFSPTVHGHTWTDITNRPATFIIAIHADATANLTATNQPNSEQELGGSQRSRVLIDCTYLEQVRLTARIMAVSNSINNPRIYPQYSTDGGTVWNTIVGTDLILTGAINNRASSWINLPPLAKADVLWRVAINGGNAVADPAFGNIFLHFK